jgi:hypothetical protein
MQTSERNFKQNLSEEEYAQFKVWLKSHLEFGPVEVHFTKKDGTERVMNCTTNASLVPLVEEKVHETNTDNPIDFPKVKKISEDVCPVWDLEAKAWRSFRWDSINQVSLSIGEEAEEK